MAAGGLIVAAPRSGAGKTTVTLGLLAALRRRGIVVRGAKSGPDYIDPGFHAAACGMPGTNLDSWAMPPALLDATAAGAAEGADMVVVESAMGLFDGVEGKPGRRGCAADLAARFGLPVLLVLDVAGQSQSAAAIARGFAQYEKGVRIAGVVLNRVGSDRHRDLCTRAITATGIPILGALPRDPGLALPERHLGLVQAAEHPGLATHLARLAEAAARHLDLDAILACAAPFAPAACAAPVLPPPGQRVALATDAAFGFFYPHLAAAWCRSGAEIRPFSPLADEAPDPDCDACWLPGGYPELHAGRLAAAARFRAGLAAFARTRPVHGECGGFMVLGAGLEDAEGHRHAMTGLLGHATSFARRRLTLGYRAATLLVDCPLGHAGAAVRGHEFRYATLTPGPDRPLVRLADARGTDLGEAGARRGLVSGTFFHAIAGDAG